MLGGMNATQIKGLEDTIRAKAERAHAQYPQYAGHWDADKGWKLVQVTRRVKTKFGEAFRKGELSLGRVETLDLGGDEPETVWNVYSVKNGIDTILRLREAVEV